jgi:hypothetical protein
LIPASIISGVISISSVSRLRLGIAFIVGASFRVP